MTSISGVLVRTALVLVALVALSACGGPQIRNLRVVSTLYDPQEMATRVRLSFDVYEGGRQVTDLSREAFGVEEDGQPASNESFTDAETVTIKAPVVLMLDMSYSMYLANAVTSLKAAARDFVTQMEQRGFQVYPYVFAATVRPIGSIDEIPETFAEGQGSERWTALYYAATQAYAEHPDAVYVLFSDGADNYSQNYGIERLWDTPLWAKLALVPKDERAAFHVIGFGNVAQETDRHGESAVAVLERIARNGTMHMAADKGAFDAVFRDVASRISRPYFFDYLSPNRSGSHQLMLSVRTRSGSDRAGPVTFFPNPATEAMQTQLYEAQKLQTEAVSEPPPAAAGAAGAGGTSGTVSGADVLAELVQLSDAICSCREATCAHEQLVRLQDLSARAAALPSAEDKQRAQALMVGQLVPCLQRIPGVNVQTSATGTGM